MADAYGMNEEYDLNYGGMNDIDEEEEQPPGAADELIVPIAPVVFVENIYRNPLPLPNRAPLPVPARAPFLATPALDSDYVPLGPPRARVIVPSVGYPPLLPPISRQVDVFFPPNFRSADKLKLFSLSDYIGFVSPADEELGITESDMTRKRIIDWTTKFCAVHYECDHFAGNTRGGTLNDYVSNSSYNPVYVLGQHLPAEDIGTLHFDSFVVDAIFLSMVNRKKTQYRSYA